MITNKANYSENLQKKTAESLGLVPGGSRGAIEIHRGYDFVPTVGSQPFDGPNRLARSEMRRTAWTTPGNPKAERLVFYELLWAPLRDQVKNHFLSCFESRSIDREALCPSRFPGEPNSDSLRYLNGAMKDRILIEGFGDAIIVLGPLGDVLRDDIDLGICMIATDLLEHEGLTTPIPEKTRCSLKSITNDLDISQKAGLALNKAKFFAMTQSLGSFLYMDTQQRYSQANRKALSGEPMAEEDLRDALLFFLTDRSTVYMMANQIALLQLARFAPKECRPDKEGVECPNRFLRGKDNSIDDSSADGQMRQYVAFNDVNDLLGFELPPYLAETPMGTFINVSVDNPGLTIPFLFKNPHAAHTRHQDNPAVIDAMVNGIPPLKSR
ncbi:hypothetical protein ACO9S2_12915 [Nitrospira sp. NS4]|uniref:hypothetical protein n=1 Tax=Nitrospira sp. NS4 TaxID=3414498 RepID=UPI003C2E57D5